MVKGFSKLKFMSWFNKKNDGKNLESIDEQLKAANQKLSDLPKTATKDEKAAVSKEITDLEGQIDAHKEAHTQEGVVKVKFTKSPTGLFKLAYNQGDEAELNANLAFQCIEAGVAKKL